jgi:hypothetical protein
MTEQRDRKRVIRQRANREGVSYSESRRRIERGDPVAPPDPSRGWYLPAGTDVVSAAQAAEMADAMRVIYARRFPYAAQLAALAESTRQALLAEARFVETRAHVGFRLGDLRADHPDGRFTYYPQHVAFPPVDYDLGRFASEPDVSYLVPSVEVGTSVTRGRAPDGTVLPLPSTPELENQAALILDTLHRLASRLIDEVSRLCGHDASQVRILFRHGRAYTPGLQMWDGGEFYGAEPVSRLALTALRVTAGHLAGIAPWPTVEDWEGEDHGGEHGEVCRRRWAQLRRLTRAFLTDAGAVTAGSGPALPLAVAENRHRSGAIRDGKHLPQLPYNNSRIVAAGLSRTSSAQ